FHPSPKPCLLLHSPRHAKFHAPMKLLPAFTTLLVLSVTVTGAQAERSSQCPPVAAPPESFFNLVRERDRDAARQFYKKYVDVKGMPVVASGEVADQALE